MTLAWIVGSAVVMASTGMSGAVALLLSDATRHRLTSPLVAFAAGSLLGGAFFHLLPDAIDGHPGLGPWIWFSVGFLVFYALEQVLRVEHHHDDDDAHSHASPLAILMLAGDGIHKVLGGLSVTAAFLVDTHIGVAICAAEVAHEIPHGLGDFAVLVHSGMGPKKALLYTFLTGLGFPVGALVAWTLSSHVDVSFLLPFAGGNFVYIAAADLIPNLSKQPGLPAKIEHLAAMLLGLGLLLGLRVLLG